MSTEKFERIYGKRINRAGSSQWGSSENPETQSVNRAALHTDPDSVNSNITPPGEVVKSELPQGMRAMSALLRNFQQGNSEAVQSSTWAKKQLNRINMNKLTKGKGGSFGLGDVDAMNLILLLCHFSIPLRQSRYTSSFVRILNRFYAFQKHSCGITCRRYEP